jgi:hypothetical protein
MIVESRGLEARIYGEHVLRRISYLVLVFGGAAALLALAMRRPDWAKGLFCGAALGWLNFRWLSRGIRAILEKATETASAPDSDATASAGRRPAPVATYLALVFRYGLVGFGAYVIFICLHVPLMSIGVGLCALVAAILAASAWEVVKPGS